jgi:hypothetical protein
MRQPAGRSTDANGQGGGQCPVHVRGPKQTVQISHACGPKCRAVGDALRPLALSIYYYTVQPRNYGKARACDASLTLYSIFGLWTKQMFSCHLSHIPRFLMAPAS